MNEQKVYLYLELEGTELDIVPLYSMFSKGKCFGSPVGETYYTYLEDDVKVARTRKEAYFQARLEYDAVQENSMSDIICDFVNNFFYEGSPMHQVIAQNRTKLWCTVTSEEEEVPLMLDRRAMHKLIDAGLDLRITVMQNGYRIQHA
ncbi:MAG: hypothetical protein KH319_04605 [Butyricicoccus pullicaecorum]|mgnify:CR=1 FL=1|jgi:hypothetical protein|nr:hypothetical protein [Butyricicoccus pullicaecorum]